MTVLIIDQILNSVHCEVCRGPCLYGSEQSIDMPPSFVCRTPNSSTLPNANEFDCRRGLVLFCRTLEFARSRRLGATISSKHATSCKKVAKLDWIG